MRLMPTGDARDTRKAAMCAFGRFLTEASRRHEFNYKSSSEILNGLISI